MAWLVLAEIFSIATWKLWNLHLSLLKDKERKIEKEKKTGREIENRQRKSNLSVFYVIKFDLKVRFQTHGK